MSEAAEPQKFGTLKGVFVPSVLTILGVILYLRLGWVVGNVNIVGAITIITLSSAITFLTGLSIAATATNMKVKGGGAYYLVSRSFGLEAGASIGVPLYLAQALGIAFYLAGFAESIHDLTPSISPQAIGLVTLVLLAAITYISTDLALRTQLLILTLIAISIVSFFLGDHTVASETKFTGRTESFWAVFAVFFPAVTGIEAGLALSGDLKNPSKALPWGTLGAVLTGYVVYISLAIALWKFSTRPELLENPMVLRDLAISPELVMVGLWGATLSSALGALLGGPRTMQALAQDRVLPQFLGKSYGKNADPRIATLITFIIAAVAIGAGTLDAIAPVLSMFFLTSYGAINLIAGLEGMISNPSWRPTFKVPWMVSMAGALACFGTMLMINPGAAIIAYVLTFGIYLLMRRRSMDASWADMRRAILLHLARSSIYRLSKYDGDARTWRPNMLVLSGSPTSRWYLIELAHCFSHGKGFLTIASVLLKPGLEKDKQKNLERSMSEFLTKRNVPALSKVKVADDFVDAVSGLVTDYGLGALEPNTIVFGESEREENFIDFAQIILNIHARKKNLLIIREDKRDDASRPVFQRQKRIDVWWGRQQPKSANLMLAFAFMLQTSPEWMGSKLSLKSIVLSEEERQGVLQSMQAFVKESRIGAEIELFVTTPGDHPLEEIKKYSSQADLIFLGMKAPKDDITAEEYSEYYEQLIEHTEGYPLTVITLAGEDIPFKDIFV